MYDLPFLIHEPVSNNAFSFERRKAVHHGQPKLYVPSLKRGRLSDLKQGTEIVFEDFDGDELKSCTGLDFFLRTEHSLNGSSLFVFDNHNHAFAFWALARIEGILRKETVIVHVDQHKDTRRSANLFPAEDLVSQKAVEHYVNTQLNVGNFLPPALECGLAQTLFHIGDDYAIDHFDSEAIREKNVILDLDLDFFAPEMEYIDNKTKIEFIQSIAARADLITVATSPFFIEQRLALMFLTELFCA